MSLLLDQLERLEQAWRGAGAPIVDHLAPGLSRSELEEAFAPFPALHPPEELFTWWGWHNGAANHMIGGWRSFMSAEEALAFYPTISESFVADGVPAQLLPISDDRPWLYIECSEVSPTEGRIFVMDAGEPFTPRLRSLSHLVETWIGFVQQGIWTYDPGTVHQASHTDGLPGGHIAFDVA